MCSSDLTPIIQVVILEQLPERDVVLPRDGGQGIAPFYDVGFTLIFLAVLLNERLIPLGKTICCSQRQKQHVFATGDDVIEQLRVHILNRLVVGARCLGHDDDRCGLLGLESDGVKTERLVIVARLEVEPVLRRIGQQQLGSHGSQEITLSLVGQIKMIVVLDLLDRKSVV